MMVLEMSVYEMTSLRRKVQGLRGSVISAMFAAAARDEHARFHELRREAEGLTTLFEELDAHLQRSRSVLW